MLIFINNDSKGEEASIEASLTPPVFLNNGMGMNVFKAVNELKEQVEYLIQQLQEIDWNKVYYTNEEIDVSDVVIHAGTIWVVVEAPKNDKITIENASGRIKITRRSVIRINNLDYASTK